MQRANTPVSILIGALGGQGGGVLAEWLVDAAAIAGLPAQSTSIPGVAQRTGATTYYVEVFPRARANGEPAPVLGLYPVPGGVDLVVASELLEAVRIVQSGMVSSDRTTLIASTSRALTTHEKIALGDGRFDSDKLLSVASSQSQRLCVFDMDAAAREAGTVVSAVMFGAIAATGLLPIARETMEAIVRESEIGGQASLRGFACGYAALAAKGASPGPRPQRTTGHEVDAAPDPGVQAGSPINLATDIVAPLPASVRDIVALGLARVVEFQDRAYGQQYIDRVTRVLVAEHAGDPDGSRDFAVTRETARFLALWMAFDDIARVAALKCRASRIKRVRAEVAAQPGDVVRIIDYFKPGVPEFAGMLPGALARRLMIWDKRRQARAKPPLSWALSLRADSVSGLLLLRGLAGLRALRRHGARYAEEQSLIEQWLAAVERGARADPTLGVELARAGRLVKGYGATNERSKRNLMHIVVNLGSATPFPTTSARAQAIREAREAALADEGGKALDATLARHGAPVRPVIAQPILWVRKPKVETPIRAVS